MRFKLPAIAFLVGILALVFSTANKTPASAQSTQAERLCYDIVTLQPGNIKACPNICNPPYNRPGDGEFATQEECRRELELQDKIPEAELSCFRISGNTCSQCEDGTYTPGSLPAGAYPDLSSCQRALDRDDDGEGGDSTSPTKTSTPEAHIIARAKDIDYNNGYFGAWNKYQIDNNPEAAYKTLYIDGNTKSVVFEFTGLESIPKPCEEDDSDCRDDTTNKFYVCRTYPECGDDDDPPYVVDEDSDNDRKGTIRIQVCGDGKHRLKGRQIKDTAPTITSTDDITEADWSGPGDGHWVSSKSGCDDQDYFFEGFTYHLILYSDKERTVEVTRASFYVTHSYPLIQLNPNIIGGSPNSSGLSKGPLTVTLWGTRPGGSKMNNYRVELLGQDHDYKKGHCLNTVFVGEDTGRTVYKDHQTTVASVNDVMKIDLGGINNNGEIYGTLKKLLEPEKPGGAAPGAGKEVKFGSGTNNNSGALQSGRYILRIREQIHDNRPFGISDLIDKCAGGHDYIEIVFKTRKDYPYIDLIDVTYDPDEIDSSRLGKIFKSIETPCAKGLDDEGVETTDPALIRTCTEINTAIGPFKISPLGFLAQLFSIVLSLAGIAAFVLFLYAGLILLTSQGNKEKIAGARETITSAITGLLFIILSIAILEFIGIDVLQIPGFAR